MITLSEEVETLNFIFHITFPFREVTKTAMEQTILFPSNDLTSMT